MLLSQRLNGQRNSSAPKFEYSQDGYEFSKFPRYWLFMIILFQWFVWKMKVNRFPGYDRGTAKIFLLCFWIPENYWKYSYSDDILFIFHWTILFLFVKTNPYFQGLCWQLCPKFFIRFYLGFGEAGQNSLGSYSFFSTFPCFYPFPATYF